MFHDARPAAFGVRLAIAIAATVGFIAVYVAAVLTERGQQLDQQALEVSEYARPALLALVSVPALAIACVAVLLLGLVSKRPRAGIAGAGIVVLANVLGQALKYEVLVRPELDAPAANTLPSGHMIAFASVAAGLVIAAPPRLRGLLGAASAALLGVVAWLLLHAGWHRPSDIVASLLLVTAVAAVGALFVERPPARRVGRGWERVLGTLGAIGLLGAALVFGAAQALGGGLAEQLPIIAADLLLVGAALACVALVLRSATPARGAR